MHLTASEFQSLFSAWIGAIAAVLIAALSAFFSIKAIFEGKIAATKLALIEQRITEQSKRIDHAIMLLPPPGSIVTTTVAPTTVRSKIMERDGGS